MNAFEIKILMGIEKSGSMTNLKKLGHTLNDTSILTPHRCMVFSIDIDVYGIADSSVITRFSHWSRRGDVRAETVTTCLSVESNFESSGTKRS